MKKFGMMMILGAALLMGGCKGCSTEETPEELKIQDSIAEIDRNESLDEADRLLREADSLDKILQDSIAKAEAEAKQ